MNGNFRQSPSGLQTLRALREAVAVSAMLVASLVPAWPSAGLESGDYQTLPGATVEERGDRVPDGSRIVPFTASLTFDLNAAQPSLIAAIPNAVLEGGDPFALTVRSSFGMRLSDDSYRFTGDYLADIYPSGTQYGFDWRFSAAADGSVAWNGIMAWNGGHLWQVRISDIALVPEPGRPTLIGAGLAMLWAFRALKKGRP